MSDDDIKRRRPVHLNFRNRLAKAQLEFRLNSEKAVRQILNIMEHAPESSIRLKAAMFVLEKGFGPKLNVPQGDDPTTIESVPNEAKQRALRALVAEQGWTLVEGECSSSELLPDSTYEVIESSGESDAKGSETPATPMRSRRPAPKPEPMKSISKIASPPSTDAMGYMRSLKRLPRKSSSQSSSEEE